MGINNVISNLKTSVAALEEIQKGGPTRETAIAITDLQKVIAFLSFYNR